MSAQLKRLFITVALLGATHAVGGVQLEPSLRIFAEERYDDDPLLGEIGQPTGLLMSKLTPQLGLQVSDPTLKVDSWYALDFTLRHGSGNTTFDHRGMLEVDKRFTDRLRLDTDLRIWRVSDPTSLPRAGMARSLAPVFYGRAEGAFSYQLTRRLTARAGYRFEGLQILEAGGGVGMKHEPFVESWLGLTPRSQLGADYRMQYFLFEDENAVAHGVGAAWRYRLTRQINLALRAGPSFFSRNGESFAVVPRVQLDLNRDGRFFDVSFSAGHDLVGASGFTSAQWADYASLHGDWRLLRTVRLYLMTSAYRNAAAPDENWTSLDPTVVSMGYALGGGVEWQAYRNLSFTLSVDRISQFGSPTRAAGAERLERNIASLRMNFRAF